MAAYTSTQTGDWDDTATWGGGGFPAAGDTATVSSGHAVTTTGAEACGTGGATGTDELIINGSLVIGVNLTLTLTGDILLDGGSLTVKDGAELSIAGTYRIRYDATSSLNLPGTSGNRATIQATVGNSTSLTGVDSAAIINIEAAFFNFRRFKDSRSFDINGATGTQSINLVNGLFDDFTRFDAYQASTPATDSTLKFLGCDFRNMPSSFAFVIGIGSTYSFDLETHSFKGSTFVGNASGSNIFIRVGSNTNPYIIDDCISEDIVWTLNCYHTINGAAHRQDNALQTVFSMLNAAGVASIKNSLVWGDYTNVHFFASGGAGGALFEDNISFSEEPLTYGNHYLPSEAINTTTLNRCICVGDNAVVLRNASASSTVIVDRLTHIGNASNSDALGIIEAPSYGGTYTQRSCVEYSTSTAERLFEDLTATGLSASSYMDYNCIYNRTFSDRYSTTMSGKTLGDVGFGGSDISDDPTFNNVSATIQTWDTSLGGAGTIANAFGELLKVNGFDRSGAAATYDTDYSVTAALIYFRNAFTPTNTALQGTGFGGDDIGARNLSVSGGVSAAFRIIMNLQ